MDDILAKLFGQIVQCRRWHVHQLLWETPGVPKVRQLGGQPNPHCVPIAVYKLKISVSQAPDGQKFSFQYNTLQTEGQIG